MFYSDLTLEQLLADPLTKLVMASDTVEEGEIRRLARRVAAGRPRPSPEPALLAQRACTPRPDDDRRTSPV